MRGLNQRTGPSNRQIVSFRVESFDEQGDRLPPVTVEMRGLAFQGSLNEGDQVEISKRAHPGRTLQVTKVSNHTAGSTFLVKKLPLPLRILEVPVAVMGYLLTALVVGGFFMLLIAILNEMLHR